MKQKYFVVLLTFIFAALLSSCSISKEIATDTIAPIMDGDQCGYVDKNGKIVIDLKFKDCGSFSDNGLAPALKDEKYGYINTKGKFVIKEQFDYAAPFSNGYAVVCQDNLFGMIQNTLLQMC